MNVQNELKKFGIEPDPLKDQFFLNDDQIIKRTVDFAEIDKNDVVLEVGAGVGSLTRAVAKKAKKVIAFEIDDRFRPLLSDLPENVELHFENAWDFVQLHGKFRKKKIYNKVVSNLPYSFIEPFLHNLTFLDYDKVVLLVPEKMVGSIETGGVFASFFKVKILLRVSRNKFYPVPKSDSVLIELVKLPDPVENKNLGRFLRQYMYQHEDQLVRNSLTEGIIKFNRLMSSKFVTKNQAREIIKGKRIDEAFLEQHPNSHEVYWQVEEKFNSE